MGRESRPSQKDIGDSKQYSPGEIADLEASRVAHDDRTDRAREELRKDRDANTARRVAEIREGEGDEAANSFQQRRDAYRDRGVEETVQQWARNEMDSDFRKRQADMERYKPKDEAEALSAVDRLWDEIDQALNYRPEQKDASVIDKNWGNAMLQFLNELRNQIRFEKSFPRRMLGKFDKAQEGKWDEQYATFPERTDKEKADFSLLTGREKMEAERKRKKWIEPKWKREIAALRIVLVRGGEEYTETPADERKRRAEKDRAVSEYQAGEIKKQVAEM